MCRWLAYSGSPILLEELLYKPEHSLIDQSLSTHVSAWRPLTGTVSSRLVRRLYRNPAVFHSIEPAWNDRNVREVAGHVESPLFPPTSALHRYGRPADQHPFRHGRWLWVHNGLVHDFGHVKRDLSIAVDESLYPHMEGSTDSELLFYLALTFGLEQDPPGAVERMVGFGM